MTWCKDSEQGFEAQKVRPRIASFLVGRGLDLGCGEQKVVETAIALDIRSPVADIKADLSSPDALRLFADDSMDYVFSSHLLEHMHDYKGALREWWRVVRYGGHLILYVPDPDYYPRVGTDGSNPDHKHDLRIEDVETIIRGFGNAKIVNATRHNESNEYSWLIVARKEFSLIRKPFEVVKEKISHWSKVLPLPKKDKKTCLVIRYGAFGDAVWMTPVLKQLKADGYYVVYNTTEYSAQVLRECPWVDEFLIQPQDGIPMEQLQEFWDSMGKSFDKVLNFSGSVEGSLLKVEGTEEYNWPHEKRHRECNRNYQDEIMKVAGYPHLKGQLPELHFTESEETMMRILMNHVKDKFVLVWSLAGSSFHKHTCWTPYVCGELYKNYGRDVVIITVGDHDTQLLEPNTPNTIRKAGTLGIRYSMLLTKYAHLVVGPETGVLNAASCFDTPKVVFLSHSSEENLTKHWKNVTALKPGDCPCWPCHRLIYQNSCPRGSMDLAPLCVENITVNQMYAAIDAWIQKWKKGEKPYGDKSSQIEVATKLPRRLRRKVKA